MATENVTDLARELGRAMTEMRNSLRQQIFIKMKEEGVDITFELLEVLALLYRGDGINQQEIADIMIKDKSSMTYLIDSLVKRGMVVRTEDENDRRNKLIFLTKEGKALQKKLDPWITEMYKTATTGINTSELRKAVTLIQNMNKNFRK
jgi:DNA-binding MarR family transcriptional regulator